PKGCAIPGALADPCRQGTDPQASAARGVARRGGRSAVPAGLCQPASPHDRGRPGLGAPCPDRARRRLPAGLAAMILFSEPSLLNDVGRGLIVLGLVGAVSLFFFPVG